MRKLASEFLFRITANLSEPLSLPNTSVGSRRILYVQGGSCSGSRVNGSLLPGGGDWVLDRPDGVAQLDIRFVVRTHDDSLIYIHSHGIFDASADVRQRIRNGESVDPTQYYFRTTPIFETGAEPYRWLNRMVAVGVGQRTSTGMITDIYAIK
jgi:hypothetical protein